MEVAIQSLDFPAPGVAVEDGLARVAGKDGGQPAASRYTAVHVLQNGKWLMASTRESGIELPSNYGRLRQLQCLIGDWETRSEGTVIQTRVRWIAQRSFLDRQLHGPPGRRHHRFGFADHRLGPAVQPGALVVVRLLGRARRPAPGRRPRRAGASLPPACWPTAPRPRRRTCSPASPMKRTSWAGNPSTAGSAIRNCPTPARSCWSGCRRSCRSVRGRK